MRLSCRKSPILTYPPAFDAPVVGDSEFRGYLWLQKTRVPGLSSAVVCVILRLAVLIQYRRVTDTHTERHYDNGIYHASTESRGMTPNRNATILFQKYISTVYRITEMDIFAPHLHFRKTKCLKLQGMELCPPVTCE